jgi:hypothetical protein
MRYKNSNIRVLVITWTLAWLLVVSPAVVGQDSKVPEPLVLRPAGTVFTPREFYFSLVTDDRADRTAVALLVAAGAPVTAPLQPVDLQGGAIAGIRQFIGQAVPANKSLRPVQVRVQECRVLEKPAAGGRVEGQVTVTLVFDIQREGKTVLSLPYKGGARYIRLPHQVSVVEPTLRQSLTDALTYLNTWMNREAGRTEKLATALKVTFKDFARRDDPDTLFYHVGQPLRWEDFRAQPRGGTYAAAVFSSFAYEGESRVVNGVIHLDLTMKVFVVRDASWVRQGRDAYALNHEQRHFDIAKLIAERFKKQVQPQHLTIADYNSQIQYQFLESWREMTALQEQYDRETRHSLDQAAQARWNQQIDRELVALGAKK